MNYKNQVGDLLVNLGKISKEEFEVSLKKQEQTKEELEQVLVGLGFITKEDMAEVLEAYLDVPNINLEEYELNSRITGLITESLARKHIAIALKLKKRSLYVAMSDPLNIFAIEDLKLFTKMDIIPMLANKEEIIKAIDEIYADKKAISMADELYEDRNFMLDEPLNEFVKSVFLEDSPVGEFIKTLLDQALVKRASDIHIEPLIKHIRIRIRIDGQLRELIKTDIKSNNAIISKLKLMANMDIAETRLPQDGRIQMKRNGCDVDLRVSTLPTLYGEKAVIRILYAKGLELDVGQLGLYKTDEMKFKAMLKAPNGIVLITGPTGSGKSTTLATAVRHINDPNINIITIEDPIENVIEGVSQVAVNVKANLTFSVLLRSILRQDPDVIMIGEIRDPETSEMVIRSAITGHLVLSSLHTNDSTSSINRLIDMGSKSYMIGSAVKGIVAQRLVGRICDRCKTEHHVTKKESELTKIPEGKLVYEGKGCKSCLNTGYKGRFGVHEVFLVDAHFQDLISKNKYTSIQLREEAIKRGMRTLEENARWSVLEGNTTIEEMLRITYEFNL